MSDSTPFPIPAGVSEDAVDASGACAILGEPESTFEYRRRTLELVLDRATGARRALPSFDDPKAERAWRARACLIVPEWGGIKLPGGQWRYSRRRLVAFRDYPYDAVVSAVPVPTGAAAPDAGTNDGP